jgi:hypothetical protein
MRVIVPKCIRCSPTGQDLEEGNPIEMVEAHLLHENELRQVALIELIHEVLVELLFLT